MAVTSNYVREVFRGQEHGDGASFFSARRHAMSIGL